MPRDGPERVLAIPSHFQLRHVTAGDAVTSHRHPDVSRHRPQVLADQPGSVTVRFEAKDGVELFCRVPDVGPGPGVESFWDPVQTMQGHDVIDAKHV